jgi:hypothetical protein
MIVTALRRSTVIIGLSFNWLMVKSYLLDGPKVRSDKRVNTPKAL